MNSGNVVLVVAFVLAIGAFAGATAWLIRSQ
jgi:hypothetical protein